MKRDEVRMNVSGGGGGGGDRGGASLFVCSGFVSFLLLFFNLIVCFFA